MTAPAWRAALEGALGPIAGAAPVAGGDINDAWRVELAGGRRIFVKTHAAPPPGMYAAEADALAWLAEADASGAPPALRVPGVLAVGSAFLALEWLELGPRGPRFEAQLGRGLAALHARGAPSLGRVQTPARAGYIATLPQDNTPAPDLPAFWIERRLRPMAARLAARLGDRALGAGLERRLDRLAARPDRFGPPEPVARLHGDLWWGNVGAAGGAPVIFDPAAYGGHREIDLAMLALFGGLGDALVGAYGEVWPLEAGWRARVGLWQLYPLAVHAALFGGGYVQQLVRGLDELL